MDRTDKKITFHGYDCPKEIPNSVLPLHTEAVHCHGVLLGSSITVSITEGSWIHRRGRVAIRQASRHPSDASTGKLRKKTDRPPFRF